MGYYDSVKDSIKDQERGENSAKGGNFDTLKENAQENTNSDDEKGDDTPIEVVDKDGVSRQSPGKTSSQQRDSSGSNSSGQEGSGDNPFTSESSGSADMSGVEDKLDKIIEQNQKMIEILESFGS
jgi:hypothetical protein